VGLSIKNPVRVAVVGYGYWGPNLVRNFFESEGCQVVLLCDRDEDRLARARGRYPHLETCTEYASVLADDRVEAVVLATPVSSHAPLAREALEAGKHVLVEKPLADTGEAARALVELAAKRGLSLMVDHTFVYTPAIKKIQELINSGELGELLYYDSVRVNLGLFQSDVNVVWDLAVHDLSILDVIYSERPEAISANGAVHVAGQPESQAYITLRYPGNRLAHCHVNWMAPVKVRQVLICGSRRMIVYDDIQSAEKLKVYDRGVEVETDVASIRRLRVDYRIGDVWSPKLSTGEALQGVVEDFIKSVRTGSRPVSDGASGLRVVLAIEAAIASLADGGSWQSLSLEG